MRELEPQAFHAALYSAVLEDALRDSKRAHEFLAEAESAATHTHHDTALNRVRVRVARRDGDRSLEEQLHLENIALNPASADAHGSYADFLLRERRSREAVARYEQATAIRRYPEAIRGLEKARFRLRLSGAKTADPIAQGGLASGAGAD